MMVNSRMQLMAWLWSVIISNL